MAAALVDHGNSPLEKDDTGLWQRRCWPLWSKAVGMHDEAESWHSWRRRAAIEVWP
jgi:hypothetical protein